MGSSARQDPTYRRILLAGNPRFVQSATEFCTEVSLLHLRRGAFGPVVSDHEPL